MDQLKAWKVFSAVARHQGLAAAARALSMSAPSVTRVMNELEAYLGTPLLHRSTSATHLTETGRTYLTQIDNILDDIEVADASAQGARRNPRGTLRVTSPVLFGQYYVAPAIGACLDKYPDVSIDAVFVDRNVSIIDEGFDVAVRIGHLPDSGLRAIRVGTVRQVICASPGYLQQHGRPQHPQDLQSHQIIHYRGTGFEQDIWRFDNNTAVKLESRMHFSNIASCIAMAGAGFGLIRVLSYQIGPQANVGELETVLDDYSRAQRPIHLIHPESHQQSAKLRAFLDIAADRLRNDTFLNRDSIVK